GDGARQQRRDGPAHAEAEREDAEQTEQREACEDRMFERAHPGATGATRVPRAGVPSGGIEGGRAPRGLVRPAGAGWPFPSHWRDFVRPPQRSPRVLVSARSTAPPAATSDAASAQKTAGYEPRPSSSSEAPTGPTARALLAPSATAPEIAP